NQVIYGFKIKKGTITLVTSGGSAIGLLGISISFFTMKLYSSSIVAFISSVLWMTLFIQRILYKKA
ncbi:MAG: hypothetical protein ACOC1P_05745, partial [Minisyncoccales bacterium]